MAHCVVHAIGMNVMVVSGSSMQCEEARERVSSAKMIHGICSLHDAYYEASPPCMAIITIFFMNSTRNSDARMQLLSTLASRIEIRVACQRSGPREPIREPNPTRGDNASVPDGAHQIHADTLRHRTRYSVESRQVTKPLEYGKDHHSIIQAD
jgi:hypothetical protein